MISSCLSILRRYGGLIAIGAWAAAAPATASDLATCAALADPAERLACFDEFAARSSSQLTSTAVQPATTAARDSSIDRRRARETEMLDNPFSLIAHRPNYILPVTYNSKKNVEPFRQAFPDIGMDDIEAKFQISFKAKIWDINDRWDLWAAYTQENWWQVYNDDESAPFRETNYQPEAFLTYAADGELFGFQVPVFNIGVAHQSNGRGEQLSRSWNRVIASTAFERGNFVMAPRVWWRIPEDDEDDDNPRTDDFYGYGDVRLAYNWQDMTFSTLLRNNLRSADNRGAVQLDWSFPLNRRFKGYVQYFYGYGESLIDYDVKTNRIGVGIMLTDFL